MLSFNHFNVIFYEIYGNQQELLLKASVKCNIVREANIT